MNETLSTVEKPEAPEHSRRVVYTCLFGYSEAFSDQHYASDGRTDFICFTDDTTLKSNLWSFRYVDPSLLGPVRTAKMVKILAHRFVGEYDVSVYMDNIVQLTVPVSRAFEYLDGRSASMVCFRHPERSCVYQEGNVVIDLGYDDEATVNAQMDHYRSIGHPADAGLTAGSILLRQHNDPSLKSVMEQWFHQVCRYSYRDQLSFAVVARFLGFAPDYFPGSLTDGEIVRWPIVRGGVRLPRGFRDDVYLALHEDVRLTSMSPREHYLKYGMAEGRPYLPPDWPTLPDAVRLPRAFRDDVYLALHEDVRLSGVNPREHYLKFGLSERRAYLPPAELTE